MDCKFVVENISDCIEGLLSPQETDRLNKHLDTCSDCRQLLADLQGDQVLLQSLDEIPVPYELKGMIRGKIAALPDTRQSAWRFFLPRLAPVAAALIITVMGTSLAPALLNKSGGLVQSPAPEDGPPAMMMEAPKSPVERSTVVESQTDTVKIADDDIVVTEDSSGVGVFSASITAGEDEQAFGTAEAAREFPLWVKTSVGGTAIFALWGGVVFFWYIKHQKP